MPPSRRCICYTQAAGYMVVYGHMLTGWTWQVDVDWTWQVVSHALMWASLACYMSGHIMQPLVHHTMQPPAHHHITTPGTPHHTTSQPLAHHITTIQRAASSTSESKCDEVMMFGMDVPAGLFNSMVPSYRFKWPDFETRQAGGMTRCILIPTTYVSQVSTLRPAVLLDIRMYVLSNQHTGIMHVMTMTLDLYADV